MQPADLIQIIRLDKKKARQGSFSAWPGIMSFAFSYSLQVAWECVYEGPRAKDLSAKQ
jgi:hypothetical protein